MSFALIQTVEVAAPVERVWEVICDLPRYREWNPFVIEADSGLQPGDPIVMRVHVFEAFAQKQTETIFENVAQQRLCYGLTGAALRSHRCHRLRPLGEGRTEYTSDFELAGPLSPLPRLLLGRQLERGFRSMTRALVERAEALERASGGG